MKKKIFLAGMLGIATLSYAQQYLGLSNSNYSGYYGGIYNPAKLSDDKIRLAVNLFSVNVLANNDFYKFKDFKTVLDSDNFAQAATFDANQRRANLLLNGEVLLPSAQFTVNDRLGIGINARMRAFSQGKDVDANFLRMLADSNGTAAYTTNERFGLKNNALSDFGISAGYKFVDNDAMSLALGGGLKMYTGITYTNLSLDGFSYADINNSNDVALSINNGLLSSNLRRNQNYDNVINNAGDVLKLLVGSHDDVNTGRGFGGDFGLEVKLKDAVKPYKLKLGASVNDIGQIKYKDVQTFRINGIGVVDPNEIDLVDINKTVDYLQTKGFTVTDQARSNVTVGLPTNVRAYVDYPINNRFFISANGLVNVSPTDASKPNSFYYNYAGVVPRYESKYFDVAVPLTYNFTSDDLKPGLAFRVGPLSVGSDDLKLLFTKSKGANLYAGLRFVLFKDKDTDGDGVMDGSDKCPTVVGPKENKGCPWPDADGDGVADKDDQCPNEAGPAENNGCPWPDADGDGIPDKDDNCPNQKGTAANGGCPDTDGDGVIDKNDDCPTVFGLAEYKGCPKPHTVIAEEVTGALRDIQFNFNKATLRPESGPKLDQAAVLIKSSDNGKFLVEGHTDKKGSEAYNLKLSRERAASVVNALEQRGVNADQLKSRGLGESEAVVPETASNEARMKDRKVVVKAADLAAWESLKKSDLPVVKKKTVKKKK